MTMKKRNRHHNQGHVYVSAETYARLKDHCDAQGISMSSLVEALTADIGKEQR